MFGEFVVRVLTAILGFGAYRLDFGIAVLHLRDILLILQTLHGLSTQEQRRA